MEGIPTKSILIIEDEKDIADLIEYHLRQSGFSVLTARDGEAGLEQARKDHPSLIILDLMLPDMDGKEVCKAIKGNLATRSIPVLMLTAKSEEVDRIVGFELGATDYVTKPFSPRELVLRVKAILQRSDAEERDPKTYSIGDLVIDLQRHHVSLGGKPIQLTATEFRLLTELATKRGRVQTRIQLLDSVWGYTYEGYARTVDTHVRRLREKLGPSGEWIETIRGVGYRFREEEP